MKTCFKSLLLVAGAVVAFAACRKFDTLPYYNNGNLPVLTASSHAITSKPADSATVALTLSWTNPHYATDSSTQKYVVEIDSAGRSFSKAYTTTVTGLLSKSFSAASLNAIAASFGLRPDSTYSLQMRVKSSYANNNEQYASNTVTATIKPYILPVTLTPSSTTALKLSINTAASTAVSFTWSASQFGTSTIYYAMQIDTSSSFKAPQVKQYGAGISSSSFTQGDVNTALINLGVTAGATANAVFRVVGYLDAAYTQPSVFSNAVTINVQTYLPFLYQYVPGAYQNWNPPTAPSLGATVPNLNAFEGYVYVPAGSNGNAFKITSDPDWNHTNYGDAGNHTYTLSASGGDITWPNNVGHYYLVKTDMTTLQWSADTTVWGIIGAATPKGWGNSTNMQYDVLSKTWQLSSIHLTAADLKFRANDAWTLNLGGDLNLLSYNGGNIAIATEGDYKVVLDLSHPRKYTATFTKL